MWIFGLLDPTAHKLDRCEKVCSLNTVHEMPLLKPSMLPIRYLYREVWDNSQYI